MKMLKEYGPSIKETILNKLIQSFDELKLLFDENLIQYPYSTRELVSIVKHLEKYPDGGLVTALQNVIGFDMFNEEVLGHLKDVFNRNGIPVLKNDNSDFKIKIGNSQQLISKFKEKYEFELIKNIESNENNTITKFLSVVGTPHEHIVSDITSHRVKFISELKFTINLNDKKNTLLVNDKNGFHLLNSGNIITFLPDTNFTKQRIIEIFIYDRLYNGVMFELNENIILMGKI
jgi:hypothetical protein